PLLSSGDVRNESASGWQEQTLPAAVNILANTPYVVTVNTGPGGYIALTTNMLAAQLVTGQVRAPSAAGRYGTVGAFPASTTANNYFRDVVFVAAPAVPDT